MPIIPLESCRISFSSSCLGGSCMQVCLGWHSMLHDPFRGLLLGLMQLSVLCFVCGFVLIMHDRGVSMVCAMMKIFVETRYKNNTDIRQGAYCSSTFLYFSAPFLRKAEKEVTTGATIPWIPHDGCDLRVLSVPVNVL